VSKHEALDDTHAD